jgi:PAS domain S-box-containing protein
MSARLHDKNASGLVQTLATFLSNLEPAFKAAPFGAWARDRSGRVILQNPWIVTWFGDQAGKNPEESGATREDIAAWKTANQRALAGHTVRAELTYRIHGKPRQFLNIVTPLRINRRIEAILGFLIDVTELHKNIDALRASEHRSRLMTEAIPMMAWHCAPNGALIEANARWYTYTGQTPAQARGNGWMKALHPDDVKRVAKKAKDDVTEGEIYQTEYRIRRLSDGKYYWHLARALPARDNAGRIIAWFGAAADIHAQKSLEEALACRIQEHTAALRESEARLKRILDGSNDGYWEWDVAANIVFMSKRLSKMLGVAHRNGFTTRQVMRSTIHPEDELRTVATVERVIRAGADTDHYELEQRHIHHNGRVVWVHVRATVNARDAAGRALRVSGLVTDITERKRLENQVLKAQEREQERIAHDLHDGLAQVLAAVSYRSDSLAESLAVQKSPEARQAAAIAQHLREAVQQTRHLATSLHPVHAEPDGLRYALENLESFVKDCFKIDCRFSCPTPVRVNDQHVATHLYRIAQEAIQNATKHGRTSCIWIALRQNSHSLSLSVRDNGVGFPARVPKRNCLGLGSMQYRARHIGGTLSIRSLKGRGVTVTCRVPLTAGSRDPAGGAPVTS